MKHIQAIGFDLFNTLITAKPYAIDEAVSRLIQSLEQSHLAIDHDEFKRAHRQAALQFMKETRRDGRETHNRFWISAALATHGHNIPPEDPRIASAVDAYFSTFFEWCYLIPGTREMLSYCKGKYQLGLLSNFTHVPAVMKIIDSLELISFFDVVLVSGELGYRKPHPLVFRRLIEQLGVEKNRIIFIGDDLESDITGARQAGLHPIWMTYVRDHDIPLTPGVHDAQPEKPDGNIPRISTWKELLPFLDAATYPE